MLPAEGMCRGPRSTRARARVRLWAAGGRRRGSARAPRRSASHTRLADSCEAMGPRGKGISCVHVEEAGPSWGRPSTGLMSSVYSITFVRKSAGKRTVESVGQCAHGIGGASAQPPDTGVRIARGSREAGRLSRSRALAGTHIPQYQWVRPGFEPPAGSGGRCS